ncbi:methyl-accepting chemotaxis protein [Alteromonas sp. C1M14]|uniref:methyl-accepting chemotaxis protein n=1 Tax=Alteromonas sp. C1M14 TaxID=2841567 RepID=UPI001C0884F4|nr:methyl-accepting chemotaxis protein [Alteromonas sp. C1M14]MBU2979818.1 chemotaxis protein [Alteromonas sp. C1M14]
MIKALVLGMVTFIATYGVAYMGLSGFILSGLAGVMVFLIAVGLTAVNRSTVPSESLVDEQGESLKSTASAINQSTTRIAIGSANVSFFLDKLADVFHQQTDNIQEIAQRIKQLEDGNEQLVTLSGNAQTKIQESDQKAFHCKAALEALIGQQRQLKQEIDVATDMLDSLRQNADAISGITTTINQLADQTNMLALNAAIEAARAGEQGRGFAVVADEVRDLAQKTANATQGIDKVLSKINQDSRSSVDSIGNVSSASECMAKALAEVSSLIEETSSISSDAANAMKQVNFTVEQHRETNQGISVNAVQLHRNTEHLEGDLKEVAEKAFSLSCQTESIFRALQQFAIEDRNAQVLCKATQAASEIGCLFESAIEQGAIKETDLFNFAYTPIANTRPQKYNSAFDTFTDARLPAIQEPILAQYPFVNYAGAVDKNGYFPTHNLKFSKPLTGNYDVDLTNNRTKRIFDDITGKRCARNTENFLLQTYKRDTGQIMHDLSVPIYVNGRHWGGLRVGYEADESLL